jgi:alpha-tubulin suppressor-like RCC1 family protein
MRRLFVCWVLVATACVVKEEPTAPPVTPALEVGATTGPAADSPAAVEPTDPGQPADPAQPTGPGDAEPSHPSVVGDPEQPISEPEPLGVVPVELALGSYYSCALLSDGSVWCWGANKKGQLGDGGEKARYEPARVAGLSDVVSISAGSSHTCALSREGQIHCWGHNRYGQLGDGTTDGRSSPVRVKSISDATAIEAGSYHVCAVVTDGNVECWGNNDDGQLGDGTDVDRSSPVSVKGLTGVVSLAAGASHTCALLDPDDVRCWGGNSYGQIGDDSWTDRPRPTPVNVTEVTAIAAGENHSLALSAAMVMRWGYNLYSKSPRDLNNRIPLQGAYRAVEQIAAAGNNTCVLSASGTVRCRGDNSLGALGNGTFVGRANADDVVGLSGASAIGVAHTHACAIVGAEIRCWGDNTYGELGVESPVAFRTPRTVRSLVGATALAARDNHTCAVTSDAKIACWGLNNSVAQLGIPHYSIHQTRNVPTVVDGVKAVLELANGGVDVCARTAGGDSTCWAWDDKPLIDNAFADAEQIAIAQDHSCKLLSNGTVKCWGANYYGQLGDGTKTNRSTPVLVNGLSDAVEVGTSGQVSCARKQDGTVWCWGKNQLGQVGNGSTTTREERGVSKPAQVVGVAGATAIAVGDYESCALTGGGTVRCWGYNKYGGVGDGTTEVRSSSVEVSGVSRATQVAVGTHHSCAITRSGAMCWGYNGYGQLGDDTYTSRTTAVKVKNLSGAVHIEGGLDHSCALMDDGSVRCWGAAGEGQLGDGTWRRSLVPVTVTIDP